MPPWLDWLRIENIRVGQGAVSLTFQRMPQTNAAAVDVVDRRGNIEIDIRK
jgi:hypothetical protein